VLLNWDDKSAEARINISSRSTSKVNLTGWSKSLEVTADGQGVVSHAGLALLRQLADKTGLTGGLSRALASPRLLIHDRGQVTADLACAIADGAEVISDFRVLADQKELFGLVASVPTAWRTLNEIAAGGPRAQARITKAVNAARRRAWQAIEARHGAIPGIRVADKVLEGVTCIRLDATVTPAHSTRNSLSPISRALGTTLCCLTVTIRTSRWPGCCGVAAPDRTRPPIICRCSKTVSRRCRRSTGGG
jgi:hypothetical protein